jgi:hypothetical protein
VAEERPVALWIGSARIVIGEFLDNVVIGAVEAGSPLERRLTVRVEDGRVYRLDRVLPEGEWRVSRLSE